MTGNDLGGVGLGLLRRLCSHWSRQCSSVTLVSAGSPRRPCQFLLSVGRRQGSSPSRHTTSLPPAYEKSEVASSLRSRHRAVQAVHPSKQRKRAPPTLGCALVDPAKHGGLGGLREWPDVWPTHTRANGSCRDASSKCQLSKTVERVRLSLGEVFQCASRPSFSWRRQDQGPSCRRCFASVCSTALRALGVVLHGR
jgi:hypothetical protein